MSTYSASAGLPDGLLRDIAAQVGTPCYVYAHERIAASYQQLAAAFARATADHSPGMSVTLCYAVKANANLEILRLLRGLGAGFDVVSSGEMRAALEAGAEPARIVFAGVGKRDVELDAAVRAGIGWINVENVEELRSLSRIAVAHGRVQRVALRVNPGIDPRTHAYLATGATGSKFGLAIDEALMLVRDRHTTPGVSIEGLHVHNGSTIKQPDVFAASTRVMRGVLRQCRQLGASISHLDMGGGFGVAYGADQQDADLDGIAAAIVTELRDENVALQLEPGRTVIANACTLLSEVLYTKTSGDKRFVIIDAAMNDLIRPALYGATHAIALVGGEAVERADWAACEVVGPICESGDFLGHDVILPPVARGDLLAIGGAGAYGRSMASNYNLRPRAAEVMVEGSRWRVIRPRERMEEVIGLQVS